MACLKRNGGWWWHRVTNEIKFTDQIKFTSAIRVKCANEWRVGVAAPLAGGRTARAHVPPQNWTYSVSPSNRPICARLCFTRTNMMRVCSKFHPARVFIIGGVSEKKRWVGVAASLAGGRAARAHVPPPPGSFLSHHKCLQSWFAKVNFRTNPSTDSLHE